MKEKKRKLQETLKISGSTITPSNNRPVGSVDDKAQEILKKLQTAHPVIPEQNLDDIKKLAEKTKESLQKYYQDQ
jgi:hypothetical protein